MKKLFYGFIFLSFFLMVFIFFSNISFASGFLRENFNTLGTNQVTTLSGWSNAGTPYYLGNTTEYNFQSSSLGSSGVGIPTEKYTKSGDFLVGNQSFWFKKVGTKCVDANVLSLWNESNERLFTLYAQPSSGTGCQFLNYTSGLSEISSEFNDISLDTWHQVSIYWNGITASVKYCLDTNPCSDWLTTNAAVNDYNFTTARYINLGQGMNGFYYDDFFYSDSNIPVEISEFNLNQWTGYTQIAVESLQMEREVNCLINEDCFIRFNYPYDYIGKTLFLRRLSPATSTPSSSVILIDQQFLNGTIQAEISSTTQKIVYSVLVYDPSVGTYVDVYSPINVYYSELSLAEQLGFDPYNIDDACAEVASSSGEMWDDFRWGIECGFNKSMYWFFHPRDKAWVALNESKNDLLNEFPINLYYQLYSSAYGGTSATSTADYELKMYVGFLGGTTSTITVLSDQMINDRVGVIWDKFYNYIEIGLYLCTISYLIYTVVQEVGQKPMV